MSEVPQQTFYVRVSTNATLIVPQSRANFSDTEPWKFFFISADGRTEADVAPDGANDWKSTSPVSIAGGSYDMSITLSSGSGRSYLYGIFTLAGTAGRSGAAAGSGRPMVGGDPIGVWGSDDEPPPKDEEES